MPPARPLLIAHRGASGYLPEHTLESASFAYASGADFIEQDVVMSKDDVLVVCHDIHIDTTTDVATRHPGRRRADGRFYALDFTWAELRELHVHERVDVASGGPVFERRFPSKPADGTAFRLCTLEEQIGLVQGLNHATGREVGIYPEIKAPRWHASAGKDPGRALLQMLTKHGYTRRAHPVYVQCFDPAELRRLRFELKTELKLIQLIGENAWNEAPCDYDALRTPAGLREIATYAQGIGSFLGQLVRDPGAGGRPDWSTLVADAHAVGLAVHPYTFRADQLPFGIQSADAALEFLASANIDGLFTDHTDVVRRFVQRRFPG